MHEDKKLLELAAKACGYKWSRHIAELRKDDPSAGLCLVSSDGGFGSTSWNPLRSNGDAQELAVELNIDVLQRMTVPPAVWAQAPMMPTVIESADPDRHAATRRAIVRAAAAIVETLS